MQQVCVAPYVGAWIETEKQVAWAIDLRSHPTWVRGLKLFIGIPIIVFCSRTLRGCVD